MTQGGQFMVQELAVKLAIHRANPAQTMTITMSMEA
jgi:hypothetical protein